MDRSFVWLGAISRNRRCVMVRRLMSAWMILSIVLLLASFVQIACTTQAPSKEEVTAAPSSQPGIVKPEPRDMFGRTKAEREKEEHDQRIKNAKVYFGFDKASASTQKSQNDALCDQYMFAIDVRNGLSDALGTIPSFPKKPFTREDWAAVGTTQEAMEAKEREEVHAFLRLLSPIVVLSQTRREQLEKSWDHTCDGMLKPSNVDELFDRASDSVRESKLDVAGVDAAFKRAAIANYKGRLAQERKGEQPVLEADDPGCYPSEADALLWAPAKQYGLRDSEEKCKEEGKQ